MATNSIPIVGWVQTLLTANNIKYSTGITCTIVNTYWEMQVPVWCKFSAASADPIISFYPSSNNGANYDTSPAYSFAIPFSNNAIVQASIRIPTGFYMVQLFNASHNTATFQIPTAQVIQAVNNA